MTWSVKRNLLHVSMISFALLIGRTPALFITFMCVMAFLFNYYLLPLLTKGSIEKPEEKALGFDLGLLSYPGSLFLLSLIFYHNQVFMAIGWTMMAFGDGFASLTGRYFNRQKGNSAGRKSLTGSAAFILFAVPLSIAFLLLLPPSTRQAHSTGEWSLIISVTAVFAMFAERSRRFIDDNVAVSFTGSLLSYGLHLILLSEPLLSVPPGSEVALPAILALAAAAILVKSIDLPGAAAGSLIAMAIWLGGGWYGLAALFTFFVAGSILSRIKASKKQRTGYEAFARSKRGWKNALANGLPASLFALMALLVPGSKEMFQVGMFATLACAMSDTFSSELGTAFGSRFLDIRTMRRSDAGPDGVISQFGLLAGLTGAILIASISYLFSNSAYVAMIVFSAGFLGNILDTLLGAWPQRLSWMSNHSVNFSSTLMAGIMAVSVM